MLNPLTPNDHYRGRTAPLTSKLCILYIYSTNIGTEYFKHGIHSPSFPLQNAVCIIILTYLVPVLFAFYLQGMLKLKKNNSGAISLRKRKKNCDVHLKGECRETSKCVIKTVKCSEHRYYTHPLCRTSPTTRNREREKTNKTKKYVTTTKCAGKLYPTIRCNDSESDAG